MKRTTRLSLVDRHWQGRPHLEQWLVNKGVPAVDVHAVQRLVVRPHLPEALAVFLWDEDRGQLYFRLALDRDEIVPLSNEDPPRISTSGQQYPAQDTLWVQALRLSCPSCGARPGDWCVTRNGIPVARGNSPHSRRR